MTKKKTTKTEAPVVENELDALMASIDGPATASTDIDDLLATVEVATAAATEPAGEPDDLLDGLTELVTVEEQEPDLADLLTAPEAEAEVIAEPVLEAEPEIVAVEATPEPEPVKVKGRRGKHAVAIDDAGEPLEATHVSTAPKVQMSRADTLLAKGNLEQLTKIGIPEDEIPELVERIKDLPDKVQHKAYNMIRYLAGREQLSVYSQYVFKMLMENGPLPVTEIVKRLEGRGFTSGTARSQAQQINRLFRAYKMTDDENKSVMALKKDHPFVRNLIDRMGSPTTIGLAA